MLTSQIIARFELQVDDASELSTDESVALAQQVYTEVCNDRDWEWLKATATGTMSTSVDYIALPADFKKVVPNSHGKSVVFVGSDYSEYEIIPFSSRRDYRDQSGYAYIDIPNSRLVFTKQPTEAKSIEFDYIKKPDALTIATEPILTSDEFGVLIAYGMASKFNPIEQTEKSMSYQKENNVEFLQRLSDFRSEDAEIKLSI